MTSRSQAVLSYGDTVLYQDDLSLLQPGCWLNDNLIAFYLDYLSNENKNSDVQVIHPSTMMLLAFTEEVSELREMVMEPLDLQNKKIILIPINNNSNATSVGGSHWSLLVFERLKEAVVFRHFDSFGGLNDSIAKKTAKKFASMLQLPFDPSNANQFVSDAFGGKRQTNGYDCGIYLLAFAEKILQSTQSGDINNVQPEDAKQMRGDLLQLIHRLSSDPKYKPKSR